MKRPEDVRWRIVETAPVKNKLNTVFMDENRGAILQSIYNKLREELKTYPPNKLKFSEPKLSLSTGFSIFWVRSQNSQILLRAIYFVPSENCVVDRFYLAEEKPKDLDLD